VMLVGTTERNGILLEMECIWTNNENVMLWAEFNSRHGEVWYFSGSNNPNWGTHTSWGNS
jgi:hypothetical protein